MKEREVQDENTSWKCVQVFSAVSKETSKEAERLNSENDHVDVVCTPSGGAQTVRLSLQKEWYINLADNELRELIKSEQRVEPFD